MLNSSEVEGHIGIIFVPFCTGNSPKRTVRRKAAGLLHLRSIEAAFHIDQKTSPCGQTFEEKRKKFERLSSQSNSR